MVSVLNKTHFLAPQVDLPRSSEYDFGLKEQEYVSMIKKCKNLDEFKQVHGQILKLGLLWGSFCASNLVATCALSDWGSMGYASSIFRGMDDAGSFEFNSMIRGHVKGMNLEEAILLYVEMLEREAEPDNFTYPSVLKACALLAALETGMQIHGHMFKLGFEDDVFALNSLINMYGKCGELGHCCAVFEKMENRTLTSWSAFISAHANLGIYNKCLQIFREMCHEESWRLDEIMLVNLLSACTHLEALDLGRSIHGFLLRNVEGLNVVVQTSLIDMYIKCGSPDKGHLLFNGMTKRNKLSCSVMIYGFVLHGQCQEALEAFSEMLKEGIMPDDVVYVAVLSACSRGGLVDEGLYWFERMQAEHGIKPTIEHYGCVVDLLGRAGMLDRAFQLIENMPMKPNDVIWRSLLNACKLHKNVDLGDTAAKKLWQLKSQNAGDYLVLSNMYAQAQKWHDVARTRTEMIQTGLTQTIGFSSVEVKKKIHRFVSQDMAHPQCNTIHEMLHQMEWQLKFDGYSPDTSQVLLDVDEEEKKQRLSRHSQKLAIAFALINTSQGYPIRILRNVRMCNDCHKYTKLISSIYGRKIIVKDRNRFHHFKDGTCSCGDYW